MTIGPRGRRTENGEQNPEADKEAVGDGMPGGGTFREQKKTDKNKQDIAERLSG